MPSATGNSASMLRSCDGFTLVELLVAVAIGSLLVTLAIQHSPGPRTRFELERAAREIAGELARERNVAIAQGKAVQIDLDQVKSTITYASGQTRSLPSEMKLKFERPLSDERALDRARIVFFPDGTATHIRLALSLGDRQKFISLNWLTGLTVVHD